MTDFLMLAEEQIDKKQEKEIKKIKEKLEQDKEILKKALELVCSHTLYKKVDDPKGGFRYVLVTREIFEADYLGDPQGYSNPGIHFDYDCDKRDYNTGILLVNGHHYYDIRYALNHYEDQVREKASRIKSLNSRIRELEDDLEKLKEHFPMLKKIVMEYMAYQEVSAKSMDEENE